MKGIYLDPESSLVGEHFAVVYAPRRQRGRFPEECVELVKGQAEAVSQADPERHRFAAKVVGPARSSEGFRLYYLIRWLDMDVG
jgi:hypothetical protein